MPFLNDAPPFEQPLGLQQGSCLLKLAFGGGGGAENDFMSFTPTYKLLDTA